MDDLGKAFANGFGVLVGIVAAFYFLGKILAFFGFVLWITSPFWLGLLVGWIWVMIIWKIRDYRYNNSWEVIKQKEEENKEITRRIEAYSVRRRQLIRGQRKVFADKTNSKVNNFVRRTEKHLAKEYNHISKAYYRQSISSSHIDMVFGKYLDGKLPDAFNPSQHFEDEYSKIYSSLFNGES